MTDLAQKEVGGPECFVSEQSIIIHKHVCNYMYLHIHICMYTHTHMPYLAQEEVGGAKGLIGEQSEYSHKYICNICIDIQVCT